MTPLARLLELARQHSAEALRFMAGKPPALVAGGTLRVIKLPPLAPQDVRALALELARAAGAAEVGAEAEWPPLTAEEIGAWMARIAPERSWQEYERHNDTDFAYDFEGRARFRVNVFRDRKGPGAVLRCIPSKIPTVDDLGIPEAVRKLCELAKGLVLVTGPTGSGKSTTLCALLDLINRTRAGHVVTLEDPIEFVHENIGCLITQREIGVHTKSFRSGLRAALREDPDVLFVGEMRDLETIALALETAEAGHLVFGTLHTTTAANTIHRIVDQFPAGQHEQMRVLLSESLRGIVSQLLLKRVGGGRVAAREILLSIQPIANMIREGKAFQISSVMQTHRALGMITLNDALVDLVDAKIVEPGEAYSKAVDKPAFVKALAQRGIHIPGTEVTAAGSRP